MKRSKVSTKELRTIRRLNLIQNLSDVLKAVKEEYKHDLKFVSLIAITNSDEVLGFTNDYNINKPKAKKK